MAIEEIQQQLSGLPLKLKYNLLDWIPTEDLPKLIRTYTSPTTQTDTPLNQRKSALQALIYRQQSHDNIHIQILFLKSGTQRDLLKIAITTVAELQILLYSSKSILNTVVNVVGIAQQTRPAYPAFFALSEKQRAQTLCNDVLEKTTTHYRV